MNDIGNKSPKSQADIRSIGDGRGSIRQLAGAIEETGRQRGLSRSEIAGILGITIEYFNALLADSGDKSRALGRPLLEASAGFLGQSVIGVMLMAGLLDYEDLVFTPNHEEALDSFYSRFSADPLLCGMLPTWAEWKGGSVLSDASKYRLVHLFSIALGQKILESEEFRHARFRVD